jgi:hypothetical protein
LTTAPDPTSPSTPLAGAQRREARHPQLSWPQAHSALTSPAQLSIRATSTIFYLGEYVFGPLLVAPDYQYMCLAGGKGYGRCLADAARRAGD